MWGGKRGRWESTILHRLLRETFEQGPELSEGIFFRETWERAENKNAKTLKQEQAYCILMNNKVMQLGHSKRGGE